MPPAATPSPNGRGRGYDELFAALHADRAWGVVTVQLKDGEAVLIEYRRTFKTIDEARRGLARDRGDVPLHEDDPGGQHARVPAHT